MVEGVRPLLPQHCEGIREPGLREVVSRAKASASGSEYPVEVLGAEQVSVLRVGDV